MESASGEPKELGEVSEWFSDKQQNGWGAGDFPLWMMWKHDKQSKFHRGIMQAFSVSIYKRKNKCIVEVNEVIFFGPSWPFWAGLRPQRGYHSCCNNSLAVWAAAPGEYSAWYIGLPPRAACLFPTEWQCFARLTAYTVHRSRQGPWNNRQWITSSRVDFPPK